MSLFVVKPHEPVFVNIDQHGPTVSGLYTIEPAMLQRGGTQRYYQRPRLKPSIRDAFIVIKESILILLLVAGYSPFSLTGAIDRDIKNTLNNWASMTSVLIRRFGTMRRVCGRNGNGRDLVVVAGLRAALCKKRQCTAEWILLPTVESALYTEYRCSGCINVTINKALLLRWSTCFETTIVAQWINLLPTRYISQYQRSLVLIIFVATWSLPPWASINDELVKALREVQQLANSLAVTVADVTSKHVSARQSLNDESNKQMINYLSTVSRGSHSLSVVALVIAIVALVVAITTFKLVNSILRRCRAAITTVLFCGPIRCAFINRTENAANRVKVVSALKVKYKRVKYRPCMTRNQTLETLETQVTLMLHTTGITSLDYGPQQITEITYEFLLCGLLITDVVKGTTINCDCCLNDDIKVAITNLWTTAPILSTPAEQVDPDATLTHS